MFARQMLNYETVDKVNDNFPFSIHCL